MNASTLPKGKSAERTEGRPVNEPGIYVHKDTGAKFITSDGEPGILQADALLAPIWKDAWERVGDVPTRVELLELRKQQQIKDAAAEALQKGKEDTELKEATKRAIEAAKANAEPVAAS